MRWLTSLAVVLLVAFGSSAALAAASGGRVWVAPFAEANESAQSTQPQPDWISRALHQSVVDDLASIKGINVDNKNPTTRPADADYVVSATIQRVQGELRVTGRIEETASNKIVGGFKATGGENELFAIEDSIAGQIKSALAPAAASGPKSPLPTTTVGGRNGAGGTFEGSDLQRALDERDYLRRLQQQSDYQPPPTYGITQPVYPSPFSLGGGYYYPPYYPPYYGGGYGYGWYGGGSRVIIINNGRSHGGGRGGRGDHGDGGGGVFTPSAPAPLPAIAQNEAVRRASSWAGNPPSTAVHEISPGPQWVPGGATSVRPSGSDGTIGAGGGFIGAVGGSKGMGGGGRR